MAHQILTIQKWEIKLKRELGFKITKPKNVFASQIIKELRALRVSI